MDISASDDQKQPISDDQELAKALAGVTEGADDLGIPQDSGMPGPIDNSPGAHAMGPDPSTMPAPDPVLPDPVYSAPAPSLADDTSPMTDPALDSIKQDALAELRPLVDKLDVNPEEKFNTYLLLIRSTDDKSLISPAHEAAKSIEDEAKKAQALLDIIKEIDFLSSPQQ